MSANAQFLTLQGAADFLGPGAIEVNMYQSEIFDIVRRRGVLGQRIKDVPATGHPSRYFEQNSIVTGTFQDPRALAPTPGTPSRQERPLFLKAVVAQINYSQFDLEVTQQQKQFDHLEAQDLHDTVDGTMLTHDKALWNGTDTNLAAPTTVQYVGLQTQITLTATIAAGASIIDGLKAQVAAMFANPTYEVRPTAIYVNPILGDLIDREAKALQVYFDKCEIVPGVFVKGLQTQAGMIPIIADPLLPSLPSGSLTAYPAVILSEPSVEYHYLTNKMPRVFQLGLLGNLALQKVVVKYGAPVAKGAAYAHAVVSVLR
jgi:hypothetical protein